MQQCLIAAENLEAKGISTTVADARFAKPLDHKLIMDLCLNHEAIITIEEGSIDRFRKILGKIPNWEKLETFLPKNLRHGIIFKSAIAATFAAGVELVKAG